MADILYFTEGDTDRVVGAIFADNGTAVDLTAADAIEAHFRNRSTGVNIVVSGLSGDANGAVSTTIPGPLTVGKFTLEWQVTTGSQITTYPGNGSARPLIVVRQEAD